MTANINPICILDINFASANLLNQVAIDYPSETFYYYSDFNGANLDEWAHKVVLEKIKEDIESFLKMNPKLLIVLGSEYFDYAKEYFESLNIPVINVIDAITNHLNNAYPKRNIAFLASSYVNHAGYFQKNTNYGHYYQVDDDELERIVLNKKVKTGVSFDTVKRLLSEVARKNVDLIATNSCNVCLLSVEVKEILPKTTFLNTSNLISAKIETCLSTNDNVKEKGKGKVYINLDNKDDLVIINNIVNIKNIINYKNENDKKRLMR